MVVLLFLSSLIFYVIYIIYRNHTHLNNIPAPPCNIILGHVPLLKNSRGLMERLKKYAFELGGIMRIYMPPYKPSVIVSDSELLKILMTSEHTTAKSLDYKFLKTWLGEGLITSEGNHWKNHRRLLMPCFGRLTSLKQFIETFETKGDKLIEKLKNHLDNSNLDVFPFMKLFTVDVLCESAMGLQLNCQDNCNIDYFKSIENMCKITLIRMRSPLKRYDSYFKLTEEYQIQNESLKVIDSFYEDVVNKKRNNNNNNSNQTSRSHLAFLDLLLQYEDGSTLTAKDIKDEINTFMFGGHDTTATALAFTLFILARHPAVQDKIIEEQRIIFWKDFRNPKVSYNSLQQMKYLEMVINEALRIYPPIPAIGRRLTEDIDLGNGIVLPKNLNLILPLYCVHQNPKYFKDPEKFIPERFEHEEVLSFTHLPFSAGQRNCIGKKYAMLQMKSCLSKIVRHFHLLPSDPEYELDLVAEMTLVSKNGVRLSLRERNYEQDMN